MISSTFGARLGGTTVGGHQGFESLASSLITPSNFAGGGGSCFPSMVVVALGEPGVPVTCCPNAELQLSATNAAHPYNFSLFETGHLMRAPPLTLRACGGRARRFTFLVYWYAGSDEVIILSASER